MFILVYTCGLSVNDYVILCYLDVYGLCPTVRGPGRVGSGRVADKVRASVWWNLETTRQPDPTGDKVCMSGPHSGIWTYLTSLAIGFVCTTRHVSV